MDSLYTNHTLSLGADIAYTNSIRDLNSNEGFTISSDRISIPYTYTSINDTIRSWNGILTKQECSINTYNEAMEFTKSDEENICIKSSVLEEMINHIKELEEINAKNWVGLLNENIQ